MPRVSDMFSCKCIWVSMRWCKKMFTDPQFSSFVVYGKGIRRFYSQHNEQSGHQRWSRGHEAWGKHTKKIRGHEHNAQVFSNKKKVFKNYPQDLWRTQGRRKKWSCPWPIFHKSRNGAVFEAKDLKLCSRRLHLWWALDIWTHFKIWCRALFSSCDSTDAGSYSLKYL